MVAAPVAAVKSRIVVATANANRVKTSQHSPLNGPKQKAQHSVNSGQVSSLFKTLNYIKFDLLNAPKHNDFARTVNSAACRYRMAA